MEEKQTEETRRENSCYHGNITCKEHQYTKPLKER